MKVQKYIGCTQHTFQHALMRCLESDYALLGSRRILQLIASDINRLVEEFYPPEQHPSSGWMIYTGTKASAAKAYPGKRASDFELVTIAWPVLTPDDLQRLNQLPNSDAKSRRKQWLIDRLLRIIEHGLTHQKGPVLLTLADLACLLGSTTGEISTLLQEARQQTGKSLTTKGHYFDIGMKPTHKAQIVELYEQGLDEVSIARKSNHDQSSVGRYIRDYQRVKKALQKDIDLQTIPRLLNMLKSVVNAYVELVKKYHPEIEINVKDQNTA